MPVLIEEIEAEFLTAAARYSDLLYVAATHDPFVQRDLPHAYFLAHDAGEWASCGRREWKCVGMTVVQQPAEMLVAISEDGDVFTYVGGNAVDEQILPAPVVLRSVTTVDGHAVAFGMRRQVYRRTGAATWHEMSAPYTEGETAGFEALCAFSANEMYAVGWRGEVWLHDGSAWSRKDSPTSVILTACVTHDDGQVYACGQNAVVLQGRGDVWKALDPSEVVEDLWGMASFGGRLFCAAFSTLYELVDGALVPVDEALRLARTFHTLTHADGVLWSIGATDLLSFDGQQWTKHT